MADFVLLASKSPEGTLAQHGYLPRQVEEVLRRKGVLRSMPRNEAGDFLRSSKTPHSQHAFVEAPVVLAAFALIDEALNARPTDELLTITAKGTSYDDAMIRIDGEGWVEGKSVRGWTSVEMGLSRPATIHSVRPEGAWHGDSLRCRGRPRVWTRWGDGLKRKYLREMNLELSMVPLRLHPHWRALVSAVESRPLSLFRWAAG